MASQPDSRLISSGVYHLLSPDQRTVLDAIVLRKTVTTDTVVHSIRDVLLSLSIEHDGTLAISAIGYALPHCERRGCSVCRTTDRYLEAYPPRDRTGAPALVQHLTYLATTSLGNLRVRCHVRHLRDTLEVEGLEAAKERLAYSLLESRKVPSSLLAYCYLIQCRVPLTPESLTAMSAVGKGLEAYRERYGCLKRRVQHDRSCKEATSPPYQVYDHSLELVRSVSSAVDGADLPDPAYYLAVPSGGNAYLCLLRKSLRMITPELVYALVNAPGSAHVIPVSAEECRREGISGGYVRDKERWVSTASSTEEERLYARVDGYEAGCLPTPEQVLPDLRRRMGMSETLPVHELALYDRIRGEKRPRRVSPFTSSREWDLRAVGRYILLLFSYRMVVYRPV
jgi:hypothetical protein